MVATLADKREGLRVTFGLALKRSTDRITPRRRHDPLPALPGRTSKYRYVYLSHMGDYAARRAASPGRSWTWR